MAANAEGDSWKTSQTVPWTAGDSTSPIRPSISSRDSNASPIRHRNSHQSNGPNSMADTPRTTSPFHSQATRQPPIGQSTGLPNFSPHKPYLDPTSDSFSAKWPFDEQVTGLGQNGLGQYGHSGRHSSTDMSGDRPRTQSIRSAMDGNNSLAGYDGADRVAAAMSDPSRGGSLSQIQFSHGNALSSNLRSVPGQMLPFSVTSTSQAADVFRDSRDVDIHSGLANLHLHSNERPASGQIPGGMAAVMHGPMATHNLPDQMQHHRLPSRMSQMSGRPDLRQLPQGADTFTGLGLADDAFTEQYGTLQGAQLADVRSISPTGSEYRRGFPNHHSTSATPDTGLDYLRTPSRGGPRSQIGPSGHPALLDRKLRGLQQEQQGFMPQQANTMMMANEIFRGQYAPHAFQYNPQANFRINPLAPYLPYSAIPQVPLAPRGQPRDVELGHHLRSPLLIDFRSNNKSSKRYELKVGVARTKEEESLLIDARTSTIMLSSSVEISMDLDSSNKSWKVPTVTKRIRSSVRSDLIYYN